MSADPYAERAAADAAFEANRRNDVTYYRRVARASLAGAMAEVRSVEAAADRLVAHGDWAYVTTRGRVEDVSAALAQARVALNALRALLPAEDEPISRADDPEMA
jgi:hypothetical protein